MAENVKASGVVHPLQATMAKVDEGLGVMWSQRDPKLTVTNNPKGRP